jgi:hypothetical protein
MAQGQRLRTLWLYSRNGGLNRPVEIESGSLLGSLLNAAGRALSRTEEAEVSVEVSSQSEAPVPARQETPKEAPLAYIPLDPEAPGSRKKSS